MCSDNSGLDLFFYPKSIAIIGASEAINSWGARYIKALQSYGFSGKLFAVNHTGNQVWGLKIYRSILDISDDIELVLICVPARYVPDIIQECIKKNIKNIIVLSAGFSETGEEGKKLEEEISNLARRNGVRIMGPNCFGIYCPEGRLTYVAGGNFPKESGNVALIAQSGTFAEAIVVRALSEGIRFSKVISYGNACDLNEADFLEYLMHDPKTRIFLSYTEGVKEGRRFFDIARQNSGTKPIVIWKVGLTSIGSKAAVSHTGSLAGNTAAWEAFFKQSGAIQVKSFDELIDSAVGFTCLPDGCGPRIALVSGGGGSTVVGADACELAGLQMPGFSSEIEQKLREVLPAVGTSVKNPLDIGNPHPPLKLFRSVLEIVASSPDIDIIVIRRIFFSIKISRMLGGDAAPSYEEQDELLQIPIDIKNHFGKAVAIILDIDFNKAEDIELEADRRRIRDYFFRNGIPTFLTESRAFNAIAGLAKYKARKYKTLNISTDYDGIKVPTNNIVANAVKNMKTQHMNEIQCKDLLKKAGVNVVETFLARNRDEAIKIADRLGYPVVMKIVSSQIIHKTDVGGVRLNISDAVQVGKTFDDIIRVVNDKLPEAKIEGISIQKMVKPGLELVIGMTKDPQFGPMLMFGIGGIFVEILKDVSFRIVPLSREDARNMIREIKGYRLLEGFRGQPAVDINNLEELLLKLSKFVETNPEIREMDINPLIANEDSLTAVDARILLEPHIIPSEIRNTF